MNLFSRKGAVVSASLAAILTAAGAGTAVTAAGAASTPLQVTFSNDTGSSAGWSAAGEPQLSIGTGTWAVATVADLGTGAAPDAPPSFTTDNYSSGSPRWDIFLKNGNYLFGFPSQMGGSANDSFTGNQWQPEGKTAQNAGKFESYQKALSDAGYDSSANPIIEADVLMDADQASTVTDTIASMQYGGETIGGGTVTFGTEATQHATKGTAYSLADQATTTSSDPNLTYAASGLPSGLQIDNTGTISGTPTESGQFAVTVHATDVYGDGSNYQHFVMDVASGVTYTQTVSARGPVKNANSGLCMDVPGGNYAAGTGLQQWACGAVYGGIKGADQNFQIVTLNGSDGSVKAYLEAIGPKGQVFYVSSANGGQLTLTTAKADMLKRGAYYTFPDDTRSTTDRPIVAAVDGASKTNGAKVIGWPKNTATYEQWTNP